MKVVGFISCIFGLVCLYTAYALVFSIGIDIVICDWLISSFETNSLPVFQTLTVTLGCLFVVLGLLLLVVILVIISVASIRVGLREFGLA